MKKLRVGIIGCGKVTELCYLPASNKTSNIEILALVDINEQQVSNLAEKFNVPFWTENINDVYDKVDAVVIALPNHLHASVSIEFLKRGIHVLVEKPMALTLEECDNMIQAAELANTVLSVGLMMRYYPALEFVKCILGSDILGKIQSFDFSEGCIWQWDSTSDYRFRKEKGGGILFDMGTHLVDTAIWCLGDMKEINYSDDSRGGIEANFLMEITLHNGVKGTIEISANRNLRNTYRVIGEKGELEFGINPQGPISIVTNNQMFSIPVIENQKFKNFNFIDAFIKQFEIFYNSAINGKPVAIGGNEGKKSVEVIQNCLNNKNSISYPWE